MNQILGNLLFKNWQYKIAAVFIAVIIWFFVVSEQNLSILLNAPLELSNYPTKMRLTNKVRTSIDLSLEGRRDIITKINKSKVKVQVNLAEAKEGENTYIITASRIIGLPRGVSIRDISPARVVIRFDNIIKARDDGKKEEKK